MIDLNPDFLSNCNKVSMAQFGVKPIKFVKINELIVN